MSDVCVGTSVGTITEPECLGPCEPGTSVTLEGIVWHETEGGEDLLQLTYNPLFPLNLFSHLVPFFVFIHLRNSSNVLQAQIIKNFA